MNDSVLFLIIDSDYQTNLNIKQGGRYANL